MRITGIWQYFLFGLLAAMLPTSANAATDEAQACLDASFDQGTDSVVEICSRAIDAGTAEGATLVLLDLKQARAFYRVGRLGRALSDVESALAIDAQNSEALVLRANINIRIRQYPAAMRDVLQAISLKPSTYGAYLALATLLRAGDPDRRHALAALQQELRYNPDNWFARREVAECYLECFGRIDEGLAEINKVIAAGPEVVNRQFIWHRDPSDHFDLYAYAMLTRANMYRRLRKFDLAKADYDWLIAKWPKEQRFYFRRAEFFSMAGQRDKALSDFGKALALAPYEEDARIERAALLMALNRDDEALKDINFDLRGCSKCAEALSYRAAIYKKRGEQQAALEDLQQAFSVDKDLVRQYQQRLIEAGYYDGKPDGLYSETMRNGVKACLIDPRC